MLHLLQAQHHGTDFIILVEETTMTRLLSKNDCYYIAYNHKYVVFLGNRNAVYSRHDWTKITTFTVYQCMFGLFLSDDERVIKTTSGRYFIYNILEET